jgi:ribosomal protein S18 acetylase RimI-like enzyme
VLLRSPEPADAGPTLEFVRQLCRESFRYLNHPPSFFERMTVAAQAGFLESLAAHPRSFLIAAWLGDTVVGSTSLTVQAGSVSAHVGELGLGVLAAVRRLGLGRILTETLVAEAEERGVPNLILRVRTFNDPAIRLYESVGFTRVGVLREFADLPEGLADEYIYQRIGPAARR